MEREIAAKNVLGHLRMIVGDKQGMNPSYRRGIEQAIAILENQIEHATRSCKVPHSGSCEFPSYAACRR